MKNVKLFDTAASPDRILLEVVVDGVVGIFGGRLAVRDLAGEVGGLARTKGLCVSQEGGYICAGPTYNHSRTELAYIFDENKYSPDEALKAVEDTYDKLHP
ncbi:hypothetical protein [Pseudomonas syringae]|uniref:hypothetical protein n=1 Tax=Pseudomonas syringae TaxID=317 RepID=UPI0009B42ECA|nr:hypothetical protein [Pseudomonas syringae]